MNKGNENYTSNSDWNNSKLLGKSKLPTKHMYRDVEVKLHAFVKSAVCGRWNATHPAHIQSAID
jgi:hypothetical protein